MIQPEMTPLQMLTDPEEGDFLQALVVRPADRDRAGGARATWWELFRAVLTSTRRRPALLRYAQYLRGRDEARAEFLRLLDALARPDAPAGSVRERQARYQELLGLLAPFHWWLRLVQRNDRVLNCGAAPAAPPVVRFQYLCPNQWETLSPTPEPGVRHCGACRRNVYFCDTVEAAERHARQGDCITVPLALTLAVHNEVAGCVTGQPDVHELWGRKVFAGVRPAPAEPDATPDPAT